MKASLSRSIHHPFLLADNRHYTFYVWRRIFQFHPLVPYVFAPGYLVCAWTWFLRIGQWLTLTFLVFDLTGSVDRCRSDLASDAGPSLVYDSNAAADSVIGASLLPYSLCPSTSANWGYAGVGVLA